MKDKERNALATSNHIHFDLISVGDTLICTAIKKLVMIKKTKTHKNLADKLILKLNDKISLN